MRMTSTRRTGVVLPAMLAMVLAAAPAYAGSPASDAYNGQGNVLDQTVAGGGNNNTTPPASGTAPVTAAQPASGSSLPFTGFDVALLLAGGLVLLGVGVAMRHMTGPGHMRPHVE
jgi:hypothetical protein